MIATRYRKALRDLVQAPGRSLLTVVAMAAGVFQIAVMLYAYALLRPELTTLYGRTRPASATVVVDRADRAVLEQVRHMPGVAAAEARPVIVARARDAGGDWVPALVSVVPDFDAQQLDLFARDTGLWPPGPGDVLLERTALRVAGVRVGDSLTVRNAGGVEMRVHVAGTVHAPGLPPAWMEHMVPAFVGADSRLRTPEADESAQVRIVATHPLEEGYIRELTDSLKVRLEAAGRPVGRITVPTPGRHPHADQMESFLFLLLAFGLLGFLLSAVLTASMVHALLAEQVRQVGIMKTLGATRSQVAGIYLAQVGALALAALVIGLPPGLLAGRAYAGFSAGILNTDVSRAPFPVWVVLAEGAVGLLVPLLVALGPIRHAAAVTVREAIDEDGAVIARLRAIDAWMLRLAWLPRPLALSLRATLARRARLALAVGLMAGGGAVFMAALNVGEAWRRAVRDDFAHRPYDLALAFTEPVPVTRVRATMATVPEVVAMEDWPGGGPWLIGRSGVAGMTTALLGIEPGSPLFRPRIARGASLSSAAPRGAVVNEAAAPRAGLTGVGDTVRVRTRARGTVSFAVAGIARELMPMPVIYAPRAAVLEAMGQSQDSTRNLRLVTRGHDGESERRAARAVEAACQRDGLPVSQLQRSEDAKQGILDHLVIILSVLTTSAVVVVFVGTLGLASSVALSVVQRTRELGVMSAIGATPATLARHVWLESLTLGLLSWAVAGLVTLPITFLLEWACGWIFFKIGLDFYVWPTAPVAWLALVLLLSTLASLQPAWRAARLTVREALSHT